MINRVKKTVKTKEMSAEEISEGIEDTLARYTNLADRLGDLALQNVNVPLSPAVNEAMKNYSLCELAWHLDGVGVKFMKNVKSLANGENIDYYLPANSHDEVQKVCGLGDVSLFELNIRAYLEEVEELDLHSSDETLWHGVFGHIDAYGWHACILFHLLAHLGQLDEIEAALVE